MRKRTTRFGLGLAGAFIALTIGCSSPAVVGQEGQGGASSASAASTGASTSSAFATTTGGGGSACHDTPAPPPGSPPLGATITPEFASLYSIFDLGPVPGLPYPPAGATVDAASPNDLLVGAVDPSDPSTAGIYRVGLERGPCGHIVGFAGNASLVVAAPGVGQNLAYGPKSDLFFPTEGGDVSQLLPGATTLASSTNVIASGSGGVSLAFVPEGYAAAGELRLLAHPDGSGAFYHVPYAPDGPAFDVQAAAPVANIDFSFKSGGIAYVPAGSPGFPSKSLVAAVITSSAGPNQAVIVVDADDQGDPDPSTLRSFITGLDSPTGSYFESQTGDFLFSVATSGGRLAIVQGFPPPPPPPK